MMKKFLLMVSALCIAVGIAGCGEKTANDKNDNTSSQVTEKVEYSDKTMQKISDTFTSLQNTIKEIDKNKDKILKDYKEAYDGVAAEVGEVEKQIKKMNDMNEDELDELNDKVSSMNNTILEIVASGMDETKEYKTYKKDEPNAQEMNAIIDVAKKAGEKRSEISKNIKDDSKNKGEFDKLTEELYNIQQTINNKMEGMSKQELKELKSRVDALKDALDKYNLK